MKQPHELNLKLELDGHDGVSRGRLSTVLDEFESQQFSLRIALIEHVHVTHGSSFCELYLVAVHKAHELQIEQMIRHVPPESNKEVWALCSTGFVPVDFGVTFACRLDQPRAVPDFTDLVVRKATDNDMKAVVAPMVEQPWGSR